MSQNGDAWRSRMLEHLTALAEGSARMELHTGMPAEERQAILAMAVALGHASVILEWLRDDQGAYGRLAAYVAARREIDMPSPADLRRDEVLLTHLGAHMFSAADG